MASYWNWLWLVPSTGLTLLLIGIVGVLLCVPTIAAAACPSCYGMVRIGDNVFVDAAMGEQRRRELQVSLSTAESKVTAFFGSLSRRRIILACADEDCERRLASWVEGSAKVRAFAYRVGRLSVIRLSPRGQSHTIIAHELSHVQVREKIGPVTQLLGVFPAWFDEGLAVLVSEDDRYFNAGESAAERCLPTPDEALPSNPVSWDATAGASPWIYANAACQVMRWMETHGGREAVLAAIADVGAGKPFPQ
jgi:hypothetical protein